MDLTTLSESDLLHIETYGSYWDRVAAKNESERRCYIRTRCGIEIGDEIEFVRHGKAPASGTSTNHRDGTHEKGLSVYMLIDGQPHYVGYWFVIAQKPAYRGRGVVVGWGSDCEPLVEVISMKRAKEFDLE